MRAQVRENIRGEVERIEKQLLGRQAALRVLMANSLDQRRRAGCIDVIRGKIDTVLQHRRLDETRAALPFPHHIRNDGCVAEVLETFRPLAQSQRIVELVGCAHAAVEV